MTSPIPHTRPLEFPIRAPIAQPLPQTRYGLSNYCAYLQALEDSEQAQTLSQDVSNRLKGPRVGEDGTYRASPRVGRGWGVLGTVIWATVATLINFNVQVDRPLEWAAIGAACWMLAVARAELSRGE